MNANRIDKKYYSWIWCGLFFASLVRFAYQLYTSYIGGDFSGITLLLNIFFDLIFSGLIPTWLCFCCASIFWSMSFKRGYRGLPRGDFIYLTMLFTAGARMLMGIIEIFALIDSAVYTYTSIILDVTVLTAALYIMYFAVLAPRYMNPKESYEVFSLYSMIYMVFQALHTCVPCVAYFILAGGTELDLSLLDRFGLTAVDFAVDSNTVNACIVGLAIFGACAVITAVLGAILKRKAKGYTPPEQKKNDDNPFDSNPFVEDGDGKVFEDFDI